MGYRDIKLALSTSQNLVASADSESFIDTEQVIPGWEKGMPAAIIINVETVNTAATGYTIEICHKADAEPTNDDATYYEVVLVAAQLTAGAQIVLPLLPGIPLLRFVRLYFAETGGTEDYVVSAYFTPLPAPIY